MNDTYIQIQNPVTKKYSLVSRKSGRIVKQSPPGEPFDNVKEVPPSLSGRYELIIPQPDLQECSMPVVGDIVRYWPGTSSILPNQRPFAAAIVVWVENIKDSFRVNLKVLPDSPDYFHGYRSSVPHQSQFDGEEHYWTWQ